MRIAYTLLILLLAVTAASAAELPADLVAAEAPAGAVSVVDARARARPGEAITVRGYVGGRAKPFIDGRAMFVLADPAKAQPCNAVPGDACPTPWDACCASREDVKAGTATVQVVGADGKVVGTSLAGVGGIKPGSTVVVSGTVAASSSEQVLIIDAAKLYVEPVAARTP